MKLDAVEFRGNENVRTRSGISSGDQLERRIDETRMQMVGVSISILRGSHFPQCFSIRAPDFLQPLACRAERQSSFLKVGIQRLRGKQRVAAGRLNLFKRSRRFLGGL